MLPIWFGWIQTAGLDASTPASRFCKLFRYRLSLYAAFFHTGFPSMQRNTPRPPLGGQGGKVTASCCGFHPCGWERSIGEPDRLTLRLPLQRERRGGKTREGEALRLPLRLGDCLHRLHHPRVVAALFQELLVGDGGAADVFLRVLVGVALLRRHDLVRFFRCCGFHGVVAAALHLPVRLLAVSVVLPVLRSDDPLGHRSILSAPLGLHLNGCGRGGKRGEGALRLPPLRCSLPRLEGERSGRDCGESIREGGGRVLAPLHRPIREDAPCPLRGGVAPLAASDAHGVLVLGLRLVGVGAGVRERPFHAVSLHDHLRELDRLRR